MEEGHDKNSLLLIDNHLAWAKWDGSEMQTARAFHGHLKPKTHTAAMYIGVICTMHASAVTYIHPGCNGTCTSRQGPNSPHRYLSGLKNQKSRWYSVIAYQFDRPQKMKAWIKLCAFLVCSGSPHMTTMKFVSPGFGSWTVIEAPDICRVHITESFRTVNTPLP